MNAIEGLKTQVETAGEHQLIGRSLTEYYEMQVDQEKTLLGNRFLCREGGMLFVGPSGVGKSSASVQQDILWALGRPAFGIKPARPLKVVTVQAENDDGDLTEMTQGIMDGLKLTADEREAIRKNTFYISEKTKTGTNFIMFMEDVLRRHAPDVLRIDPLQSYLGGDSSGVEVVSSFIHTGLNPLLQKYSCSCIINHHTPKTNRRDTTGWKASDWQYAGAGSAVLTNWARAILVIDPCEGNPQMFWFIAAKRGKRVGWHDEHDVVTTTRYFKHAREDGVIFWEDATPEEILSGAKKSLGKNDVLFLVPDNDPISKDALISKAKTVAGIGEKTVRRFINELKDDGILFSWNKPRQGTRPRIFLARFPQPETELKT